MLGLGDGPPTGPPTPNGDMMFLRVLPLIGVCSASSAACRLRGLYGLLTSASPPSVSPPPWAVKVAKAAKAAKSSSKLPVSSPAT